MNSERWVFLTRVRSRSVQNRRSSRTVPVILSIDKERMRKGLCSTLNLQQWMLWIKPRGSNLTRSRLSHSLQLRVSSRHCQPQVRWELRQRSATQILWLLKRPIRASLMNSESCKCAIRWYSTQTSNCRPWLLPTMPMRWLDKGEAPPWLPLMALSKRT